MGGGASGGDAVVSQTETLRKFARSSTRCGASSFLCAAFTRIRRRCDHVSIEVGCGAEGVGAHGAWKIRSDGAAVV